MDEAHSIAASIAAATSAYRHRAASWKPPERAEALVEPHPGERVPLKGAKEIGPTTAGVRCLGRRQRPRYDVRVKFRVLIEQDEDGVFVATCPSLPGCVSQGKTRTEASSNAKDAIAGYLASLAKHGEPIPPPTRGAERSAHT